MTDAEAIFAKFMQAVVIVGGRHGALPLAPGADGSAKDPGQTSDTPDTAEPDKAEPDKAEPNAAPDKAEPGKAAPDKAEPDKAEPNAAGVDRVSEADRTEPRLLRLEEGYAGLDEAHILYLKLVEKLQRHASLQDERIAKLEAQIERITTRGHVEELREQLSSQTTQIEKLEAQIDKLTRPRPRRSTVSQIIDLPTRLGGSK